MKILIIWSLLLLIIFSAAFFAQADDYFDYITVYSEGRITRFKEMPIMLYVNAVNESPKDGSFLDDLNYTLCEWEKASEGKIEFELTEYRDKADITLTWSQPRLKDIANDVLGDATIVRQPEGNFRVEVTFFTRIKGSNKLLTHEQMRAICLHELGHAIGLWGHSPKKSDVMFFASEAQHPTARDINTLTKLYESEPNYPRHEQAISVLKSSIEKNPKNPRLQYLLGSVYLDKGNCDLAIDTFKHCLKLDSSNQKARKKLIQAYQSRGRQEDALEQYKEMVKIAPSAENYNALGKLYYEQGYRKKAIECIEKAYNINPRYPKTKNNLYNLYREQGLKALENQRYSLAISSCHKAVKLVPNDSNLYALLGEIYSRKNEHQNAIEQYQKALQFSLGDEELKNNLAISYNNLGVKLQNKGDFRRAIDNYKKASELMPQAERFKGNLLSAYSELGAQLFRAKNYAGAIKQWQQTLAYNPKQIEIYNSIGGAYFQLGNYPKAIESFQKVFEIDSESAEVKSNLVATYQQYAQKLNQQSRYQDAVAQLQKALEIEPENVDSHLNLGYIYYNSGQTEKALAEYEKALAIDPINKQAQKLLFSLHINQGNKYMQARNYSAAITEFETVPVEFRNVDIYNTLGYLYMEINQFSQAIAQFNKILSNEPSDKTAYQNLKWIEFTLKKRLEESDSPTVRNDLALAKSSLALNLLNRKEEMSAKAKLREALDLNPQEIDVRKILVSTCLKLINACQKKKWQKSAAEAAQWVLEIEPQNKPARKILQRD